MSGLTDAEDATTGPRCDTCADTGRVPQEPDADGLLPCPDCRAASAGGCRWCPPGCKSCEPDDCECYTHQDEPDRAASAVQADKGLRARIEALCSEWERVGGPARVAFLVAADELRTAAASPAPTEDRGAGS
jgi:hypothetical protein